MDWVTPAMAMPTLMGLWTDSEEIDAGSDPLDSSDAPEAGGLPIFIFKAAIDAAKGSP